MTIAIESNFPPEIKRTITTLTFANTWDHILARWAVNRMGHRVEPGLYSLGNPLPIHLSLSQPITPSASTHCVQH